MKWILVCEADESIVGDGKCDAEAADYECLYDGGDCKGTVTVVPFISQLSPDPLYTQLQKF